MRLPGYGTRGRVGLATGPAVPDMVHTRLLGSLEAWKAAVVGSRGGRCGRLSLVLWCHTFLGPNVWDALRI